MTEPNIMPDAAKPQPVPTDSGPAGARVPGPALTIGIVLLAPIFVWFLLRPGYTRTARILGFSWAGLILLISLLNPPSTDAPGAAQAGASDVRKVSETTTGIAARKIRFPGEPSCTLTNETSGWEFIKGNAIRTADQYAVEHNPAAAFATANGEVFFQVDGPYKGKHTLNISNDQIAMAQLLPLFDFCTPASQLDDEGKLWKVVKAKLNGREF